ncbi:hypothetical protein GCM10028827_43170 [Mucilaginibacter myungsuensis]
MFPPHPSRRDPARDSALIRKRDSLIEAHRDTTAFTNAGLMTIGLEPIFHFNNALKFDLAYKFPGKKFGLELTPEIYTGQRLFSFNGDRIDGFGIGLYHQSYITNGKSKPIITSLGLTYRAVNVKYNDEGFIPEQRNGLTYYRYREFEDVVKAQNIMINATVAGRLTNNRSPVFLDIYCGVGYKFGSESATYPGNRNYKNYMWDFGYNGATLLAGVKFGPSVVF